MHTITITSLFVTRPSTFSPCTLLHLLCGRVYRPPSVTVYVSSLVQKGGQSLSFQRHKHASRIPHKPLEWAANGSVSKPGTSPAVHRWLQLSPKSKLPLQITLDACVILELMPSPPTSRSGVAMPWVSQRSKYFVLFVWFPFCHWYGPFYCLLVVTVEHILAMKVKWTPVLFYFFIGRKGIIYQKMQTLQGTTSLLRVCAVKKWVEDSSKGLNIHLLTVPDCAGP